MNIAILRKIWRLLILRDNWQGEFCVALFGAIGWALIDFWPAGAYARPQSVVLDQIAAPWFWQAFLLTSGATQLYGLRSEAIRSRWFRVSGALGVLTGFVAVFLSVLVTAPGVNSLSVYLSAICIEVCAVIYQTATLLRTGGLPKWLSGNRYL